jgi:hypothetical protein
VVFLIAISIIIWATGLFEEYTYIALLVLLLFIVISVIIAITSEKRIYLMRATVKPMPEMEKPKTGNPELNKLITASYSLLKKIHAHGQKIESRDIVCLAVDEIIDTSLKIIEQLKMRPHLPSSVKSTFNYYLVVCVV